MNDILQKGLNLLLKKQTNILSAAFIIMSTVILSQFLGLIRQRLLVAIFGASNTLGVYLASIKLPDFLFQIIIAGALSSAFIPVFSDFLVKGKEEDAKRMASSLLTLLLVIFSFLSVVLFIFAYYFIQIFNPGSGFSDQEMILMANLMRLIIIGQLLFVLATFFSVLLQSYNHFFIPGIAAATYNLGIIIGILTLSGSVGIYSAAYGIILGGFLFVVVQLPLVNKTGFSLKPLFSFSTPGILEVIHLMWPRTFSIGIFQLGSLITVALISYIPQAGRNYVIFDYAQTLAYAPIALFGQTIAQAAFPVLSREREKLEDFKKTFLTSFNQMLYLILPISALFLVLRIPVVRLVYGAGLFDWNATVLTGKTLAYFSISIFANGLIFLVSRGFYALHDAKTPLIAGAVTTLGTIVLSIIFVVQYKLGIENIAFSYSLASIANLLFLLISLDRKVGGFKKTDMLLSTPKIFFATIFMAGALYIPIKLLDQLVFDTTHTINLIILTGISSFAGLSLYLFLTWIFNVKEASIFLLLFKKIGNYREILLERSETLDPNRPNP